MEHEAPGPPINNPPLPSCFEWLSSNHVPSPSSSCPPPLVVIFPWMWAAHAPLLKQAGLYQSLGCDVAILRGWPALSVWAPPLARHNASVVLSGLAAHLAVCRRDVLIVCCSGAAKGVLCPILDWMAPAPLLPPAPQPQVRPAPDSTLASSQPTAEPAAPRPRCSRGWWLFCRKRRVAHPPAPEAQVQQPERPRQEHRAEMPAVAKGQAESTDSSRPSVGSSAAQVQAGQDRQQPPRPRSPAAALLRSCLRGFVFDSGPVDFDSSVGVRLFANGKSPWLRQLQAAAGAGAAGLLDFFLFEMFEAQRRQMWHVLRCSLAALRLPVLFVYSWTGDALANPQPIHALALALRGAAAGTVPEGHLSSDGQGDRLPAAECASANGNAGLNGDQNTEVGPPVNSGGNGTSRGLEPAAGAGQRSTAPDGGREVAGGGGGALGPVATAFELVREQTWELSGHVAHLRNHPEEYRAAVEAFLALSLPGRPAAITPARL